MSEPTQPTETKDPLMWAMTGGFVTLIAFGVLCLMMDDISRTSFWIWISDTKELSASETIRNYGFIIAGFLGLVFAFLRARIADRDNKIATKAHAREVNSIAAQTFQNGAAGLGAEILSIRIASAISLSKLFESENSAFQTEVLELFESFIKEKLRTSENTSTSNPKTVGSRYLPEDVSRILQSTVKLNLQMQGRIAQLDGLNLRNVNLRGYDLRKVDLTNATLDYADLEDADLRGSNLSICHIEGANWEGVDLRGADLAFASFKNTTLSNAKMEGCDCTMTFFDEFTIISAEQLESIVDNRQLLINQIGQNI